MGDLFGSAHECVYILRRLGVLMLLRVLDPRALRAPWASAQVAHKAWFLSTLSSLPTPRFPLGV